MFDAASELRAKGLPVYDLSLGNPDVEPPQAWKERVVSLLRAPHTGQHRYMNGRGLPEVRSAIARRESARYGIELEPDDVTMTVGAAGALSLIFRTFLDPGDEVLTPAPYFTEYANYAASNDARLVTAPTTERFELDVDALMHRLGPRTRLLVLNSPNNPSGAVYDDASLAALARRLAALDAPRLVVVEDTPYRSLMHDGSHPPALFGRYRNTLLVCSHSKDLGLAGERIGYVLNTAELPDRSAFHRALEYWQRTLGFVNAPALMQRSLSVLSDEAVCVDVTVYARRCASFARGLRELGFWVPEPRAGFFLFAKLPASFEGEAGQSRDVSLCAELAQLGCLVVPGVAFGRPDYVRIALCADDDTSAGALAAFRRVCVRRRL